MKKFNSNSETVKVVFGENFIKLSRPLIKIFGLNGAVLLCDLYGEYLYWLKKNKVNEYGYFQSTVDNVTNNTGLSAYEQRAAIDLLTNYGVLKSHVYGMPAVRYFKITNEGLEKLKNEILKDQNRDSIVVDESISVGKTEEQKVNNDQNVQNQKPFSLKDIDPRYIF